MSRHGPILTGRALNRATLARQHLLKPTTDAALDVVRHLVGLQAQAPFPPYYGLWARIDGFAPEHLVDLLLSRSVVRLLVMRGTVHLVAAADAVPLRRFTQPLFDRAFRAKGSVVTQLSADDLPAVAARTRELMSAGPLSGRDLGRRLAESFPAYEPRALSQAAVFLLPLVQVPPRAIWRRSGQPTYSPADVWLADRPDMIDADTTVEPGAIVLRYLAAFGPATVADIQAWCGLTRLRAVVDGLRDRLVSFTDPHGRELLDLPEAPRPDPDTPAPVRFVAPFDNLVLSHADRTRVLCDACRRELITINGQVPGPVLVDGEVVGSWRVDVSRERVTVDVRQFHADVSGPDAEAVEQEARRVAAFTEPDLPVVVHLRGDS